MRNVQVEFPSIQVDADLQALSAVARVDQLSRSRRSTAHVPRIGAF